MTWNSRLELGNEAGERKKWWQTVRAKGAVVVDVGEQKEERIAGQTRGRG